MNESQIILLTLTNYNWSISYGLMALAHWTRRSKRFRVQYAEAIRLKIPIVDPNLNA